MGQWIPAEAQVPDARQDGGGVVRSRWVAFNESADLKAAGQPAPGANADVKDNAASPAEFGYHFTPNIRSDC